MKINKGLFNIKSSLIHNLSTRNITLNSTIQQPKTL